MIVHLRSVLTPEALAVFRSQLEGAVWDDKQPAQPHGNYLLPETSEQIQPLRRLLMEQLQRNALFFSAALPRRLYPASFMRFGGQVALLKGYTENPVRMLPGTSDHIRTDLCCTLFISGAGEYDGGELLIEDGHMTHRAKFAAGDAVLYPATHPHRIESVTSGQRTVCTFLVESMVREDHQRALLYELDIATLGMRLTAGENEHLQGLASVYQNLLRMWAVT